MNALWAMNDWVTTVALFLIFLILLAGALIWWWYWDEKRLKIDKDPKEKNRFHYSDPDTHKIDRG